MLNEIIINNMNYEKLFKDKLKRDKTDKQRLETTIWLYRYKIAIWDSKEFYKNRLKKLECLN